MRYVRILKGKTEFENFPDKVRPEVYAKFGWHPAPEPVKQPTIRDVDEITGEVTIDEMPEPHAAKIGRPKKIK